ncbi:LPXTG cell wall anchor domain-containing protein [Staphylococcus agnetis]|nr:LPXTG cell wall anchor domain-containing protein [Staphylococcus agnetis]MBY7664287.1 LPXTG cell wall anchor domain-containing protein [Staphylococcus agnetis]MCO4325632.1 LPXTG cell wall anchor domain-containing protein [Staphylococcus agnetis]MCO4346990.1 LPXTG cell wall anchor domain-containing protein [Staphylococcus agnetis]MCO4349428.1 LPXTG cell wall anchor domain-containing protein [Staphylococcus agnetis]MCO4352549.1 LPXTG cell wall anchor domain-containing protein [Staphylococcus 
MSLTTSESQTPQLDSTAINNDVNKVTSNDNKVTKTDALPDTGQATQNGGLIGAVAAMLAGLGLLKRSKKDQKKVRKSNK